MKAILIMAGIILLLFIVLIITLKIIFKMKRDKKLLEEKLKSEQDNILYLYKHAEEIAVIEKDRSKTDREIEEAKSDEEVLDIINSVIAVNNSRVRNDKKN